MKSVKFAVLSMILVSGAAFADLDTDLNGLGGNKDLIRRAKGLDPKNRVSVVQNRSVDRDFRLEFGVNAGVNSGGDPYVKTDSIGGSVDFHFTPRWSVGGRYYSHNNTLSSEGERVFKAAAASREPGTGLNRRDIDYASDTTLGVINWYPMYGKLNLFDMGIAQFDIYLLGGGGSVSLASGSAPTWTAGVGMGFWLNQHFSTRLEARYQSYEDEISSGSRQIDLTVISASIGFLL